MCIRDRNEAQVGQPGLHSALGGDDGDVCLLLHRDEVDFGMQGGKRCLLYTSDVYKRQVQDTARVLSRYLDGIMIRTFAQQEVEDLAKYGSIPIICLLYTSRCV